MKTRTVSYKKNGKFYDFYRDGVTQSMIGSWQDCPQQCRLNYVEGWTPLKVSSAILFGNCCHHVLEQAYSSVALPLPGHIRGWVKEFEIANENDADDIELIKEKEIVYAKTEAVLNQYFMWYAKDFEHNWEITETIFKIPIKLPSGKTTYLNGMLDGGFREIHSNELTLMDHKCKSQWNVESMEIVLPADLQINTYVYAIWKYNEIHDYKPYFPKKFFYNLIRNPGLRPGKDDTDAFIERINLDVEKRPQHYFQRLPEQGIPLSVSETQNWFDKQLLPLLVDMEYWYKTKYNWPSYYKSSSLETKYGLSPYAAAVVSNDYSGLVQRDKVFAELI